MRTSLLCLFLLGLGPACATSPLIQRGDLDFARSQERLEATQRRALEQAGPGPESALFLQAESLYRDRFALRLHGAGSMTAQIAAAMVDFGPISSLAAHNGMADLRLLAYDGAAQLYEAQLARFPSGKLAPLALYRLGWAYRSVLLDDWPRTSAEAHGAVAPSGGELAALAKEAQLVPWKSQRYAIKLSLLPGLGQIYAGETANGVVRMVIGLSFLALATVPLLVAARNSNATWQEFALSSTGLIGLQVSYTTAYQDAQRAALEFNEREEEKFEHLHVGAP